MEYRVESVAECYSLDDIQLSILLVLLKSCAKMNGGIQIDYTIVV